MGGLRWLQAVSFSVAERVQAAEGLPALQQDTADVISGALSRAEEERAWITKIERLRQELLERSTEISLTDFGAGSPGDHRSAEAMYRGQVVAKSIGSICRTASKPSRWASVLFKLIRHLAPSTCLELGTSLGLSAAYQAAALELNGRGTLVTIEGAAPLAILATEHLRDMGLGRATVVTGRFQDRLPELLRAQAPIDFAFVDGHHGGGATIRYFRQLVPASSDNAVLVFDDIAWSPGMQRAWNAIASNAHTRLCIDLAEIGICVARRSATGEKRWFKWEL